ncbi:hypothetical protein [Tenuibacillus multivorans]|uniref:Uncharacterized protein n=1 Tax=Tenuibacillus multivorans TaxID=237069 RepID=A0A1G9WKK8_9BACI|nr:hypothetical protein [Tenuibacillus multivorans]GEL76492.1 hypothetical protein TMU01_07270 [Tenuibacillus multivorans]SDM84701.1 hypothetical protein SAMN05216498_0779 [Tenuibacillus multivorans]
MEYLIALIATVLGLVAYFITKKNGAAPLVTAIAYAVIHFISYNDFIALLADYKLILSALISYVIVWIIDGGKGSSYE